MGSAARVSQSTLVSPQPSTAGPWPPAQPRTLSGQRTNLDKNRSRQVTPFPENALEPLEACHTKHDQASRKVPILNLTGTFAVCHNAVVAYCTHFFEKSRPRARPAMPAMGACNATCMHTTRMHAQDGQHDICASHLHPALYYLGQP